MGRRCKQRGLSYRPKLLPNSGTYTAEWQSIRISRQIAQILFGRGICLSALSEERRSTYMMRTSHVILQRVE